MHPLKQKKKGKISFSLVMNDMSYIVEIVSDDYFHLFKAKMFCVYISKEVLKPFSLSPLDFVPGEINVKVYKI